MASVVFGLSAAVSAGDGRQAAHATAVPQRDPSLTLPVQAAKPATEQPHSEA
ncbi:MAG: hypothetical protein HC926_02455 [Synechococcaceae cyanobacterium SM2_3_60]|nr:hypothetical protein [Synechococcaceae cyanobacterium SM2_3_60]